MTGNSLPLISHHLSLKFMNLITKLEIDLKHIIDEETEKQMFPALITFYAGSMLEKEWRKKMQAHWALTDKEKAEKQAEYNVDLVLGLACKAPKGLPDFEAGEDWKSDLASYFNEPTEIKNYLAKIIVDEHLHRTSRYSFRD